MEFGIDKKELTPTLIGYSLDYTIGIVWELPDYPTRTSPDYTPQNLGWINPLRTRLSNASYVNLLMARV